MQRFGSPLTIPHRRQIRVGDFVFKDSGSESSIKLDDYMDFFDCAREIEEHKKRSEDTKVRACLCSPAPVPSLPFNPP